MSGNALDVHSRPASSQGCPCLPKLGCWLTLASCSRSRPRPPSDGRPAPGNGGWVPAAVAGGCPSSAAHRAWAPPLLPRRRGHQGSRTHMTLVGLFFSPECCNLLSLLQLRCLRPSIPVFLGDPEPPFPSRLLPAPLSTVLLPSFSPVAVGHDGGMNGRHQRPCRTCWEGSHCFLLRNPPGCSSPRMSAPPAAFRGGKRLPLLVAPRGRSSVSDVGCGSHRRAAMDSCRAEWTGMERRAVPFLPNTPLRGRLWGWRCQAGYCLPLQSCCFP